MEEQIFVELMNRVRSSGDILHAHKLQQLMDKRSSGQLNIAFCGHFSAGKSSLINSLCGYPLLPASPIPTSANIVTIRNGSPQVRVTHVRAFDHSDAFDEQISLEQLEAYCKNGAKIESIAIEYPIPFLGTFAQLLDTPGIDSTDDAHHMSTESALHLADVVFYVMDYNHVQSETNLAFVKRMKDWGKPIYLIVNQIDKHKAEQLSFVEYKRSVEECFANWQAEPSGILYTTLKQPEHSENEWLKLEWFIRQLIQYADNLSDWSFQCALRQLVSDHCEAVIASHETAKEQLRLQLSEQDELDEKLAQLTKLVNRKQQLRELPDILFTAWAKEMTSTIENANLTPAATRDLAHAYLISRKPGFKLSLFSRAAHNAKEIENRLHALQQDVNEKVKAHLSWHLKDYFKRIVEKQGLEMPLWQISIDSIALDITPEWLADQVKAGAVFTNEYTLNYSKHISAEIKAKFRKLSLAVMADLREAILSQSLQEDLQLTGQITALEEQLVALRGLESLEKEEQAYKTYMREQLAEAVQSTVLMLPDLRDYNASNKPMQAYWDKQVDSSLASTVSTSSALPAFESDLDQAGVLAEQNHALRMKQTAMRLRSAVEIIANISAMKTLDKSMRDKANRLEHNRFTIALFGAFSAGKSSFANALIGENILPVSPNPTTATINRIMPPTPEWPHGSVRIKMKTKAFMTNEIQYSAEAVGLSFSTVEQTLRDIVQLSVKELSASGKPHHSFLKAAALGWESSEPFLDNELTIDLLSFASYVAEESKSCFVERIDLYYNHPLTSQGIVFVDTPGADSIHARHTGVAFNYIKNADAIVFITYYNHAFSQADREFLMQLGRVKDSFELDKMFFIVNAADLAANETELQLVVEHVKSNLLQHSIRHPRIYPISSMEALEGKVKGSCKQAAQSGMARFEDDFIRFTLDELTSMAVHSAEQDIWRSIDVVQQRIESAQQGEEKRKESLIALEHNQTTVSHVLDLQHQSYQETDIAQEAQELLYYVKQRVSYRYGELFNLAFNPSSLREDGRDMRKALKSAWNELIRLYSYDISQEVLATTLRLEQFIHAKIKKEYEQLIAAIIELFPDFRAEAFKPYDNETPSIDESLEDLIMDEKWLFAFFKNGRYFFEGDGKAKLRNELEAKINDLIQRYIHHHLNLLLSTYQQQAKGLSEFALAQLRQAVTDYVEGQREALEMKIDIDALQLKQSQLKQLLL